MRGQNTLTSIYFGFDKIEEGEVDLEKIPSDDNLADAMLALKS